MHQGESGPRNGSSQGSNCSTREDASAQTEGTTSGNGGCVGSRKSGTTSSSEEVEFIDTTGYVAMVRAHDGVVIYFDPATSAQYQLLGYTNAQEPVYRLYYQNGTAEDMIDMYNALTR